MRNLKLYAGVLLILLTVVILAVSFFTNALMDANTNHLILLISLILVIAGVVLVILGGKFADKIGGK